MRVNFVVYFVVLVLVFLGERSLYAQEFLAPPAISGSEEEEISTTLERLETGYRQIQEGITRVENSVDGIDVNLSGFQEGLNNLEKAIGAINLSLSSLQFDLNEVRGEMLKKADLSQESLGNSNTMDQAFENIERDRLWLRAILIAVGASVVLNLILGLMLIINWNKSPQVIIRYGDEKENDV